MELSIVAFVTTLFFAWVSQTFRQYVFRLFDVLKEQLWKRGSRLIRRLCCRRNLLGTLRIRFGNFQQIQPDGRLTDWSWTSSGTFLDWETEARVRPPKSVFVLGAFKTGKSKLIDLLANMSLSDSDEMKNTAGEHCYHIRTPAGPIALVDTEGLFQYHGQLRDTSIQTMLLNHVALQANLVIYVLERTFSHDIAMIHQLNNIYQSCPQLSNIIVIHNYRNVRTIAKLREAIPKNRGLLMGLEEDAVIDESSLKTGYLNILSRKGDGKNLIHYLIGNHSYLASHNNQIFDRIRSIISAPAPGRDFFTRNLSRALLRTYHNYFSLDLEASSCDWIPSSTQSTHSSRSGVIKIDPIPPGRTIPAPWTFDSTTVVVRQFVDRTNHDLHLVIFCPGLLTERGINLELLDPTLGRLSLSRAIDDYFCSQERTEENVVEYFSEIHFQAPVIGYQTDFTQRDTRTGVYVITLKTA